MLGPRRRGRSGDRAPLAKRSKTNTSLPSGFVMVECALADRSRLQGTSTSAFKRLIVERLAAAPAPGGAPPLVSSDISVANGAAYMVCRASRAAAVTAELARCVSTVFDETQPVEVRTSSTPLPPDHLSRVDRRSAWEVFYVTWPFSLALLSSVLTDLSEEPGSGIRADNTLPTRPGCCHLRMHFAAAVQLVTRGLHVGSAVVFPTVLYPDGSELVVPGPGRRPEPARPTRRSVAVQVQEPEAPRPPPPSSPTASAREEPPSSQDPELRRPRRRRRRKPRAPQCFRCMGHGHVAKSCVAASAVCRRCAGPHPSKSCPRTELLRCALCNAGHAASSSACPVRPRDQPRLPCTPRRSSAPRGSPSNAARVPPALAAASALLAVLADLNKSPWGTLRPGRRRGQRRGGRQ